LRLRCPGTGLRHSLVIDVVLAGYGQAAQQLLDPGSEFASHRLDAVLIAFDYRALGLDVFVSTRKRRKMLSLRGDQ
jgi:predicted enzyme involved in methoxymalonyl-ACP biosynthesis